MPDHNRRQSEAPLKILWVPRSIFSFVDCVELTALSTLVQSFRKKPGHAEPGGDRDAAGCGGPAPEGDLRFHAPPLRRRPSPAMLSTQPTQPASDDPARRSQRYRPRCCRLADRSVPPGAPEIQTLLSAPGMPGATRLSKEGAGVVDRSEQGSDGVDRHCTPVNLERRLNP